MGGDIIGSAGIGVDTETAGVIAVTSLLFPGAQSFSIALWRCWYIHETFFPFLVAISCRERRSDPLYESGDESSPIQTYP